MKRYAMDQLIAWKDKPGRKPLIVKGARQVGKTWLMKEFGRTQFAKTAYINFCNNQRMKRVFDEDYDLNRILMNINIETRVEVTPGDTLLILDEIQEAPRAMEALKFFCENASDYVIVAAGSLLGVAIHQGVSFPVGKVDMIDLHPMSFREFLEAVGETLLAEVLTRSDRRLWNDLREKYVFWMKNYYYVGGMPEVVSFFTQHKDYVEVRRLQKALLTQYENDFGKHAQTADLARIRLVWNSIPMQLAKENKKFFFGQIKTGARMKDFEIAIEWLLDCGLIEKVYRVNKPAVPLKAYVDFSAFKLFLLDVGLLGALSELDAVAILEGNDIFVEFKGALTEQYVLQQIVSETEYIPYYFTADSARYEIDFMIQKGRNVIPVEVKAETNLQAKSLKAYYQKYQPAYAVRTSMAEFRQEEWLVNLPLYAMSRL